MNCASCNNEIDTGSYTEGVYLSKFGRYCQKCNARISRNVKHEEDNSDRFSYAFQLKKAGIKITRLE